MASVSRQFSTSEKQKMREEIAEQVQQFLARGGEIDVISSHSAKPGKVIGNAWQGYHEPQPLAVQGA